MRSMLRTFCYAGLLAGLASVAPAATLTMNGTISNRMCGASHAKMIAAHQGAKMTDRDCTLGCVKAGAKYVFVSQGKVYQIANQNQSDLMKNAGMSVRLTGDVSGDTITVSKVAMMKH
jgi:hypothetical protein